MTEITHTKNSIFFRHINLLRAFAALSVVFYHIIEILPWPSFPTKSLLSWFRAGWMGVDLFFVISGFVIMLSALKASENETITIARKNFFIRRAARIIPLYLFTSFIFLIFIQPELLAIPNIFKHIISHLAFVHNLHPSTHGSINGANWSIATEFQFYLLIIILLPWLKKASPLTILLFGIAIAWSFRASLFFYPPLTNLTVFNKFIYATQLPGMLDEFALGMAFAKLVFNQNKFVQFPLYEFWRQTKFWLCCLITIGLIYLCMDIFLHNSSFWDKNFMVIFWRTFLGICYLMTIFSLLLIPEKYVANNIIYKIGDYLGEISYGIYLWHLPVILSLKKSGITNPRIFTMVALIFILILSSFTWHFLEKPIIKKYRG